MAASAQITLNDVASHSALVALQNELNTLKADVAALKKAGNAKPAKPAGNAKPNQPQQPKQPQNGVLSDDQKRKAIEGMGRNKHVVVGWERDGRYHSGGAQFKGGAVVMGARPMLEEGAPGWWWGGLRNQDRRGYYNGKWMELVEPWGCFLELKGNPHHGDMEVDVRNVAIYTLRKGQNTWEKLDGGPLTWEATFRSDMSSNTGKGQRLYHRDGYDSTVVEYNTGNVSHWGIKQIALNAPGTMEGVAVRMQVRKSPKNPNARIGVQVGADYKRWSDAHDWNWYPGAGLSSVQEIGTDWEDFFFVNLNTAFDANDFPREGRSITHERFMNSVFPIE